MAIRKKSKAKVTAAEVSAKVPSAKLTAEVPAAASAAEQPDVRIIDPARGDAAQLDIVQEGRVPDDSTPDDADARVTPDDARLRVAVQQLAEVFDSIERRRLEALARREEAIQETIAVAGDEKVTAIIDRSGSGKVARLSDALTESETRLGRVAAERKILAEEMARARETLGLQRSGGGTAGEQLEIPSENG